MNPVTIPELDEYYRGLQVSITLSGRLSLFMQRTDIIDD